MVAPAATPAVAAPAPPAAPPAAPPPPGGPVFGVPVYAAPAPGGTVLVVPQEALDGLRDAGYVLAAAPAAVRIDLLVAAPPAGGAGVTIDPQEAETVLRRAVSAATLAPDPAARRLAAIGPHGAWYAALLIWGWLLLLFAAQNVAQVLGGLWLVAGLPLARRAFRRRTRIWGRRGAAGWHLLGETPEVRPLPHAGLTELARVVEGRPGDAAGAYRAAALACPGAGLASLAPFYAALAAGRTPPGVFAWVAPPPVAVAAQPRPLEEGAAPPAEVPAPPSPELEDAAAPPPAEEAPAPPTEDPAPPTEDPAPPPPPPPAQAGGPEPAPQPGGVEAEKTEGEPPRTSSTPT